MFHVIPKLTLAGGSPLSIFQALRVDWATGSPGLSLIQSTQKITYLGSMV